MECLQEKVEEEEEDVKDRNERVGDGGEEEKEKQENITDIVINISFVSHINKIIFTRIVIILTNQIAYIITNTSIMHIISRNI